jgi:hypothetical protein
VTQTPDAGFHSAEARMESFWLPPDAVGNGLDAARWAEIIVVSHAHAEQLLDAFRTAGVAARMATSHQPRAVPQDTRVWIDPDRYGEAENVLLREMSR